jgi:hypothetical protein
MEVMTKLIDIIQELESLLPALKGTSQGEAVEFAIKVMKERVEPESWKTAVLDAVAVSCLEARSDETPHKILQRLLQWESDIALDPRVSAQASALKDTYWPLAFTLAEALLKCPPPAGNSAAVRQKWDALDEYRATEVKRRNEQTTIV